MAKQIDRISQVVREHPIGLLWLDGDHRFESVSREFDALGPFIVPGGLVGFHDSLNEELGPIKVIRNILTSGGYQVLTQTGSTTVLQKSSKGTTR